MGVIQTIHQDSNHMGDPVVFKPLTSDSNHTCGCYSNHMRNPVVLFKPLTSDQAISVGVIQTIHQDSNHICLSQTIPTKILYHSAIPPDKTRQHQTSPYIPTCHILHHRFSTGSIPLRTLYCIQTGNCGTFLLVVMHPTYFT